MQGGASRIDDDIALESSMPRDCIVGIASRPLRYQRPRRPSFFTRPMAASMADRRRRARVRRLLFVGGDTDGLRSLPDHLTPIATGAYEAAAGRCCAAHVNGRTADGPQFDLARLPRSTSWRVARCRAIELERAARAPRCRRERIAETRSASDRVAYRFFRTFDQATAPVCTTSAW